MELHRPWTEHTFIAFDTETSGAYPIGCDIIEFGAVKWKDGKEVASYQTLLKPRELLTEFNMSIHGISNDMVANAPMMAQKIREIHEFLGDGIVVAHHAPFDLGFMAIEFETHALPFPANPALCTSLLARKLIQGCENHRLQTLVKYLKLEGGAAHRALDDARSCLFVAIECFNRLGSDASLESILSSQGKSLSWKDYSLLRAGNSMLSTLIEATRTKKNLEILYEKGGQKTEPRMVTPLGIVRNPDGDYLQAFCLRDNASKRFYLSKIKGAVLLY
ncbi:MAG: WYL domain-containing protein [Proteobacteria bacterium]|nr:MAG: WYL domain-containing protein [Pseudomonadota bacterium]